MPVGKPVAVIAAALFYALSVLSPCLAQGTEGSIVGAVRDATGGVIPGVDITVRKEDTGISRLQRTDEAGKYSANGVVRAGEQGLPRGLTRTSKTDFAPRLAHDVEAEYGLASWDSPGFFGNAGRNIIRGSGVNKWDVSLFKNNRIPWLGGEEANLQFHAEFCNAPNHPNFNGLATTAGSPYFGAVMSTRDPRILQFGLKIDF